MTHRKHSELQMLRDVISATAASTGQDFYDKLVRHVADGLDAHCAFLTEFDDDATVAHVQSFWLGDRLIETFDYDLAGTPCERVLDGDIVCFQSDLQALFPEDREGLQSVDAVSFLAIPLRRESGRIRGHLAVMDKREREWDTSDFGVLEIFAMRATAELDRQLHEQNLESANRQLNEMKEAAEAANRAKSEFLASMSHELRTPLNAILGYAQLLKRDTSLSESQQREIAAIERGGEHLLALINDILDMAKIEAGRLELDPVSFDLGELLNTVAEIGRVQAARKGLGFGYKTQTLLPVRVLADERRLRQVLFNLVGNAVKFTDEGAVTLRVRYENGERHDQRLHFEIEDSGIGIEASDLERIFDRFAQARQASLPGAAGTGLGLAISRQIARAMGGDVSVRSEPGKGSVFSLHVLAPAAANSVPGAALPVAKIGSYAGPRKRLLVVDDDADNRGVLCGLLESMNFEVAVAADGREALEAIASYHPDLVLMDLIMPVMDGFETIRMLRQNAQYEKLPVMAVSASVFGHTHAECLAAGFDGFLNKPVRFDQVIEAVRTMLALEWTADRPPPAPSGGDRLSNDAVLAELHEFARRGDIRALQQSFDSPDAGSKLDPILLLRLRELAQSFDMKRIRLVLEEARGTLQ